MVEPGPCPICGGPLPEPAIRAPDRLHGTGGIHAVSRCRGCEAGLTLPRVGDEQLADFYPEGYGPYDESMRPIERLASRSIRAFQGWTALHSEPLVRLRDRPPARGLDVGCGRGDLAAALKARGWEMSGVEPSASASAHAAKRGIEVHRGTLSNVTLDAASYDAVILRHSLEHTTDPVAALRQVGSALSPGGLVLISVPNFASWQARHFGGCWYHLDLPRHRVHFTPKALARALYEARLQPLSFHTSTSPVGFPASVQYQLFGRCLFS
jgi:SAM-dependent methyltransferase